MASSATDAALFAALDEGAPPLPGQVLQDEEVIAAAGAWDGFGAVLVLRRDDPQDGGGLLDDRYLLARGADGKWRPPPGCAGGAMPEWVLRRPDAPLAGEPTWRGQDLEVLDGQVGWAGDMWVADFTVMATARICRVRVEYEGRSIEAPVPASGLVTLPLPLRDRRESARCLGFNDAGEYVDECAYRPLEETDRGWPDMSLWT